MSRTSKKTIAISNNLYQRNKNDPSVITNTLETTRAEFSLVTQNLQSQINDLYVKVDDVKHNVRNVHFSKGTTEPTAHESTFPPSNIENHSSQIKNVDYFAAAAAAAEGFVAQQKSNPFVESPLSTKYTIETNTLTIEHSPESNTFFFPLGIDSIKRLIIHNIPMNANSLYKYTFYIKREPYKAGASYINVENITATSPAGDTSIIELSITGADLKKPSVNSSFIKQEFYVFCYCYRLSGFQTLVEF